MAADAADSDVLKLCASHRKRSREDHGFRFATRRSNAIQAHFRPKFLLGHLIIGNIGGTEYPVSAPEDPAQRAHGSRLTRSAARCDLRVLRLMPGSSRSAIVTFISTAIFSPAKFNEYVYVVSDPVVAGLAGARFRFIREACFRLDHTVDVFYAEDPSQTWPIPADFLYQGFNADEDGKIALDGVSAHAAGSGATSTIVSRSPRAMRSRRHRYFSD